MFLRGTTKTSVFVAFGGLHCFEGIRHNASKILLRRNGIFVFFPKALKLVQSYIRKRTEEPKTPAKTNEFLHFLKIQILNLIIIFLFFFVIKCWILLNAPTSVKIARSHVFHNFYLNSKTLKKHWILWCFEASMFFL